MNAKEIRCLKNKFIKAATASFTLVILFVGMLINIVYFIVTQREVRWSLEQLAEQQAEMEESYDEKHPFPDAPSFSEVFTPVFQNNTFYILSYDEEGGEHSFFASKGNSYSETVIRQNAAAIMDKNSAQGRYGMLYYLKSIDEEGLTNLIIMDCSYMIYTRIRLLYASIAVGIISILAALILVVCLSEKMIRPEIESSKRQIQFLTNVSHELKTPLAVIRSNAEMAELVNGENEWTQSTIRQADRMSSLIKNLVMITKTREIESDAPAAIIHVSDIVLQTAKEYSSMSERREITLINKIEPGIEMALEESKLRQLTVILLDNAEKYCDAKGIITVSLDRLRKGKNKVRLSVSNSFARGEHIDCTRFLDRFYREDTSHNIDSGGYGIGLNIAESICEQFKGTIQAQWNDGMISFICKIG